IQPASLPGGTVGDSVNQNLDGSGGTAPYSFAVVSGTLPDGLFLSAGGHLSGTFLASGSFSFTVAATDAAGCAGTQAYSLLVAPLVCPAIGLSPPARPAGTRGFAYQQTLLGSGGIPPYGYAVTAGTLPPGLALDGTTGVLSGLPTDLGTWPFTVTVTDATGCAGSTAYSMDVLPDLRGANCGLFGDTFEDGVLATDWTWLKPTWTETGGSLVGNS